MKPALSNNSVNTFFKDKPWYYLGWGRIVAVSIITINDCFKFDHFKHVPNEKKHYQ